MPKLTRITNKIFGQNATAIGDNPQIGQFGSAKAGTYIGTTDVETIQELSAWSNGWVDAVTPQNQFPALPEMTAVHKVLSRQTAYLYQEGIPEYDINTTYFKGSLVKSYSDENGIKLYYSKIDENINHSLEDTTAWEEASLGGGSGGLEIGDIGTALFVDESRGKRRKLNGSIMAINENTQGFVDWLKSVQATNPEYFTTESNWQAESALAVDGCVYKYVLDEENGTVRLPKYPEYVEITNDKLPVVGNGITMGLTDGTNNSGIFYGADNSVTISGSDYGKKIGKFHATSQITNGNLIGLTTDPTKSGIETTGGITKLKLYYFIQIATGSETQVNIVNEIELNNPYTLFDSKYLDHQLFNTSWLRSNGQYNPKAVYVKAYEALQVEYNSQVEVGTTVTLPSGTQYTKQGLSVKLSTETFNDYDFVLNTSDETFRLKLKNNLASGKAVVGNGMTLGLTDGTYFGGIAKYSGQIKAIKAYGEMVGTLKSTESDLVNNILAGITTDPTKSGIELSDSDLYLYFYVGETVQNANLIDAGRILEIVSNKQDKCIHIIDTYINGTSGYRIWSDGYCEQWGYASDASAVTVNLLKTYKDTNYNLTLGAYYLNDTGGYGLPSCIASIGTSSFVISMENASTKGSYWKASGYLADGEY